VGFILGSNIKMDLPEVGREGEWSGLFWLRMQTAGGLYFNYVTRRVSALQNK
jgi:hypothetical protein